MPKKDANVIIQFLRNRAAGRKLMIQHRYEDEYSPRSQPPPALPPGVSHKLSGNYYYLRDARGEVNHPETVAGTEEIKKLPLQQNIKGETNIMKYTARVSPGQIYQPKIVLKFGDFEPEYEEKPY